MEVVKYRVITFYKKYFEDFFVRQEQKVKDKIIWTFRLAFRKRAKRHPEKR